VYLGTPGPHPSCPAGLHGKTEAVQILPANPQSPDIREATRPIRLGGRPARTNTDSAVTHTIIDVIPAAGAEVSLSYGTDRSLARKIASTIQVSSAAHAARLTVPASVPATAPQGIFQGPGFDACAAPSVATMNSWLASPYRAVGIYIGGINRACSQSNLTAAWISAIQADGWHYFPLYPGLQASCVKAYGDATISAPHAAAEGRAAANDAATQARNLAIPPGTPIIYDMEAYAGGCGAEVITFLSAWDAQLHAVGYKAGIYESFSNIGDLIHAAGTMTEPDVIHYADWDGQATAWSSYMPATMWAAHQRIHQYQGGHQETWGGVTLDIDNDQLDVDLGGGSTTPVLSPFRIAVGINVNRSAEWFARAANGTLLHAWQHPVISTSWSGVVTVGDSPSGFVSNPAVTSDADGNLTVFARDSAGQILHAWQQVGAPNGWQWGGEVTAAGAPAITGDPSAIRLPDGEVAVFVSRRDGAVTVTRQLEPNDNSGWTPWSSIGGSCAGSPAAYLTRSAVDVFCTTTSGTLATDTWNGQSWSGWVPVGFSPTGLAGIPAVASNGAGQTEVFVATSAGGLLSAWQAAGTRDWTWGAALAGAIVGTTIRNSPTATEWPGGEVAVFARLASGNVGFTVQQGTSSIARWASWTSIGGSAVAAPAGWLNPSGTAEVAVLDAKLRLAVSSFSASRWSGWTELGGSF